MKPVSPVIQGGLSGTPKRRHRPLTSRRFVALYVAKLREQQQTRDPIPDEAA